MPDAVGLAEQYHGAVPRMVLNQVLGGGRLPADCREDFLQRQIGPALIDFGDWKGANRMPAHGALKFVAQGWRMHATGVELRAAAAEARRVESA